MHKLALAILALAVTVAHGAPQDEAQAAFDRRDYGLAMELLTPLAEAGDADALANVGNMHAFGWGVPIDRAKAAAFWFKAAEKHVPSSMGNIASCYKTGACGLAQSDQLAAQWFTRAAEHRHAPSMLDLSSVYMNGEGLPQDKVKGLAWASLAATNSRVPQLTRAATEQTYRIMRQVTPDEIERARIYSNGLLGVIDANYSKYRRQ